MSNVEKEVQGTYTSEKTGRWILSYVNGRSCTGVSPVAQMPNSLSSFQAKVVTD